MAWGIHSAAECCLGTAHKAEGKGKDKEKENDKPKQDKSLTYAAAAATITAPASPPSSHSSPMMRNDGAGWHVHGGYFC